MEPTSNEAVKQAILAGLGYSITPLIGIRNELSNHQLEIIDFQCLPIQTTWSLVWLKEKNFPRLRYLFLNLSPTENLQTLSRISAGVSPIKTERNGRGWLVLPNNDSD